MTWKTVEIPIWLFLLFSVADAEDQRVKKSVSVFGIVRFPNDACAGSESKNGTCYTSKECSARGGTNEGDCAGGYGVCCVFGGHCGGSYAENCTYFESRGTETGDCQFEVCKCQTNICQLRLDLNLFTITGPSTASATTGIKQLFGVVNPAATLSWSPASRCLTDSFVVTNPSGSSRNVICGANSGEHIYVDASDQCNDLIFQLGPSAQGTSIVTRMWSIKITQYACDYPNLAPPGCTQYFFGDQDGSVRTFNFAGGQHLANQQHTFCVRQERGQCRICWFTRSATDFAVSGMSAATAKTTGFTEGCCSYGSDGLGTLFDCLIIPGAIKSTADSSLVLNEHFCGRNAGLVTSDGQKVSTTMAEKTVCSTRSPFTIRFQSDGFEFPGADMEAMNTNRGFQLFYSMENTNCGN